MAERNPRLRYALQDRTTFENSIVYTNAGDMWIGGALLVGFGAVAYNLVSTIRTILTNKRLDFGDFFEVFMSTSNGNPIFVILVYAPFVCIAVGVAAWVVKRATLRSSLDNAHQEYLTGGFLADVWVTGGVVTLGKETQSVVAYAPPGFPDETVAAFANWVAAVSHDPKNPANKGFIKLFAKIPNSITAPVLATTIDPSWPQGLWLALSSRENKALGIAGDTNGALALAAKPVVVVARAQKKPVAYPIQDGVILG
ncbi:MAG: hypothetical protein LBM94_04940 [Propionibacteriaceae bacterium]|jgi:hypothetical protein|nr:hypothetical protein [Propionibacteriaceae bacterium]